MFRRMTVCLSLLAATFVASAQLTAETSSMIAPPQSNSYGVQDETVLTIPMYSFGKAFDSITWTNANYMRYVSSGNGCCLHAAVSLPTGAVVTRFELEGCDESVTGQLFASVIACATGNDNCLPVGLPAGTNIAATPGCGSAGSNTSFAINNATHSYGIEFGNPGDISGTVRLRAARLYYRLQVSPAPATPSFGDVPTSHPFFQFIEALAASGITAGCGNGNYCPNDPLTRGQMAVFLSRALGLHWTP